MCINAEAQADCHGEDEIGLENGGDSIAICHKCPGNRPYIEVDC